MSTIIALISLVVLLHLCIKYITVYNYKRKQNNDIAVRYRNFAILYGYLCLITVATYVVSTESDSLTNSNIVIMKETESSKTAFVSVLDDGPPVHKGLFEITQVC